MRKWGIVISVFYALILICLVGPICIFLLDMPSPFWAGLYKDATNMYTDWAPWLVIAILVSGEAILLFLSVDTTQRRLKPRAHILVTSALTALFLGVLTTAVMWCLGAAIPGNNVLDWLLNTVWKSIGVLAALWALWGVLFYFYCRNSNEVVSRAVSWLLKGSVLELLVAVPCHIIVRRRGECCATIPTSLGITTGIAIMLLSFGPSVLLLYKKRLEIYSARNSTPSPVA